MCPCTYIRIYEKHRPLLKLRSKTFHATYLLLSVSSRVGFSFNFALREAALYGFFAGYFNNLKDLLFPNRFNVNPGSKTTFNRRSGGTENHRIRKALQVARNSRSPCNAMHVRNSMPWSKENFTCRVLSSFNPRTFKRKFIPPPWCWSSPSLEFLICCSTSKRFERNNFAKNDLTP